MPKKENPFPTPGKKDVSPGLILTAELVERMPTRGEEIVRYEIGRRERDRVLMSQTKNLMSWHPWNTVRLLLLSGVGAFALAWLLSLIVEIAKLYNAAINVLQIDVPFLDTQVFDLREALPSQAFGFIQRLPDFGAVEAIYFGLLVMFAIAVIKGLFILFYWNQIKLLIQADQEIDAELETLNAWLKELGGERLLLKKAKE
ncbi:hypothetical protein GF380_04975 [Candidatus Uhrbacteria bacterium]|nr:hypothetical protein [Candidatus Uhrbacteria bacterium]MBD3284384.1 hypothetical protein [Candidatus Uhrbacteria bacterium]